MTTPDDDPLLPLAGRIADGASIDRVAEARLASADADPSVLQALLDIADIGAAHRAAERSYAPAASGVADVPAQWGHLAVLGEIGRGANAVVYRAHDPQLQIDVALKLSDPVTVDAAQAPALLDEARLLARVRHPNVARVYGADHRQGRVGLWMDLIRGTDLATLARTQGFSAAETATIGVELCRALAAVHGVGVLHGDIKAHNVVRQEGGQIVLVDFGSGRPLGEAHGANDRIGTPLYMAPEVLDGAPRSVASDIYSLGVLLFHLVTGQFPVYAESAAGVQRAHREGAVRRLRDLRHDLPEDFIHVVERATAVRPSDRFSTAGAFEAALLGVRSGVLVAEPRRARRWPVLGAWLALACGALATGVFVVARVAAPTPATGTASTTRAADVALASSRYEIEAAFYRSGASTASDERVSASTRLRVNDELHLEVQTSSAVYVYVVNEDEKGAAFLLYPLAGDAHANPVDAGTRVRLPKDANWRVDAAGGHEHFLVFASTEKLTAFETAFARLSVPTPGGATSGPRLLDDTLEQLGDVGQLRSVGGLVPKRPPSGAPGLRYSDLFTEPLQGRELADGMWVRQLKVASTQ